MRDEGDWILTPERVLVGFKWLMGENCCKKVKGCLNILSFKLVWQDEVRGSEYGLVCWNDVLIDIEFALVAHYGIENCDVGKNNISCLTKSRALPQKNDPGLFADLYLRSREMTPTASTASALGAYPERRTSKSVR